MTTARARGPYWRRDRRIGRLLILLTYVSVGLLVIGVVALIVAGISPLDGGPPLDPATIVADVLAVAPAGLLWLGIWRSSRPRSAGSRPPRLPTVARATGRWSRSPIGILVVIAIGIIAAVTGTV